MSKKVYAITVHCSEELGAFIKMMAYRSASSEGGYLRALAEADKERMNHEYTLLHGVFGSEPSTSSMSSLDTGEPV